MATTLLGSTGASSRTDDSGQRLPVKATGPNGWLASSATSSPSTVPKATSPSCENLAMRTPRGYASTFTTKEDAPAMRTRSAAAVATSALLVFVVLLVLVATGAADGVDHAVARFAAGHRSPRALDTARVVTDVLSPGVDAVVLLTGALWLTWRRRRLAPLLVAVTVLVLVAGVI